jgi:hypothetical protein
MPTPPGLRPITQNLAQRLAKGEHLVLWGPIGSGKTTLAAEIQQRVAGRACALAPMTRSLDDITRALERAYPSISTEGVSRRTARVRLSRAADREPAVLLLDHVSAVSTAMKGFLRQLRGRIAGVLLVFDIDSSRERTRLRARHLGCMSVRMPALPSRVQRALLAAQWPANDFAQPSAAARRVLIRAARGRPGWIAVCAQLAREPRYWCADGLKARVLALDSELTMRALKRPILDRENSPGAGRPIVLRYEGGR